MKTPTKILEVLIQLLIVASLFIVSYETLPGLSQETVLLLDYTEKGILFIFLIEYVVRLIYAENKLKHITRFLSIVDFLAILPLFLTFASGLVSLRALRLLRLFRILKIVRYNKALQRFHKAFLLLKEEFLLFFLATAIILFMSSVGIYHFEHKAQPEVFSSVFHSLWWSLETITTVGYGDAYPVTVGGKLFTFVILMIGLGIVAVPAGLFASALTTAKELEKQTILEKKQ